MKAPTSYTTARQQQVELLHHEADRLFDLNWLFCTLCRWQQQSVSALDPAKPEDFSTYLNQPACQFATSLLKHKADAIDEIRQLIDNAFEGEMPLQQLFDRREQLIDELCEMGFALNWNNVRPENDSWMRFACRMPFGSAEGEKAIGSFFQLICQIALITDVFDHRGARYGFDIDYSHFDQVTRPYAVKATLRLGSEPFDEMEKFHTEKAQKLWKKLQAAGLLDDHCQPVKGTTWAVRAVIADRIASELGLINKWKSIGCFWNLNDEALRSAYNKAWGELSTMKLQDKLKAILG